MPSDEKDPIREIQASDRASFEKLLNSCFPVPPGKSFFHDFPIWDPLLFKNAIRLGHFKEDEVKGCACARFGTIQGLGSTDLSVALVGAVATHPEIRGQGVASDLLESLLARIDEKKVDLTLLWGSEHDLYRRFGFELAGEQIRIPLKAFLSANPPQELRCEEAIQKGYFGEIFKRRMLKKVGLVLKDEDLKWYGRHSNVAWWSLMRNGAIAAYLAVGRGIDLEHMVHEWDGSIEDVLKLFLAVSKTDPSAEWLTSPGLLGEWGIKISESSNLPREFLCMARPGPGFDQALLSRLWIWGLDAC